MLGLLKTRIETGPHEGPPLYPYNFSTSGFVRVDKVRFLIEGQSEWDYSYDRKALVLHNSNAAARYGYGYKFTDEQVALGQMLSMMNAGPHIMTYAWGLYDSIASV